MTPRRVAVTGLGAISAIGNTAVEFWQSLRQGRCGIGPIEAVDRTQLKYQQGAEVRGFDPHAHFQKKHANLLDRFAQFALVAAREAVADAGIEWTTKLRANTGVITGSCLGGQNSMDDGFADVYIQRYKTPHPLTILRVMAHGGASHTSIEFGLTGPSFAVSTGCASATHAIGQGYWMVRNWQVEAAIVGGSEATFSLFHLKSWEALRALATDTCRPFSKNRSGLILGEGAAMLVLEPLEAARARGAKIYAELSGFGMSSDARHVIKPSPEGAAQAIHSALLDAELRPEQVGYVNAHGTGAPNADASETLAIHAAFGRHAEKLAVSSTKSMHGHALGATGALEAVATILALRHGVLPPTANFTEADPQCDLDVIPNVAREADVEYALSNSFAFGGLNAVLAFRRWTGGR
ncbi:MAG: beta-ketoacyl-[acyl-carrier-protein] synthase family protein [Acidobacteriota bacterium]